MKLIAIQFITGVTLGVSLKGVSVRSVQNTGWFPLPVGFDQAKPGEILGHVRAQASRTNETLPFSHVYVFGDSACDTHNVFELNDRLDPNPEIYWDGRISNGPMWPDYMENKYHINIRNHAFAGATVSNNNFANDASIPDFKKQVDMYSTKKTKVPKPLAVVQFIGNDLLGPDVTADKVASDMEEQLERIVAIGEIHHFLILESQTLSYIQRGYSAALISMARRLQSKYPKITIITYPIIEHYASMASYPPPTADPVQWHSFGQSCYNQDTGSKCDDPQNFFLFDLYHPSTVPHHNLAIHLANKIMTIS